MDHFSPSIVKTAGPRLYRTENLCYTKGGLLVLSFWLLWGDFAFNFFESVFGRFLPIYLKDLQASNTLIGVMAGSFAGLVNVLFLPGISRWSDDFRSAIGRRVPLLYLVTPLTVFAVVAIGFAPEIASWFFDRLFAHLPPSVTKGGLVLGLLCGLTVSFHFFNMVLVNAYNWLIRDVVPLEVMSRLLAWFSIVGTVSGTLFLWFVFPHLMTNRRGIFLAVGLFYLVAFLLMCRNVKEGQYPPHTPSQNRPVILKTFVVYFRECLEVPLYRNFFIVSLLVTAALNCAGGFLTLFASDTLSINMANMGHIFAWTSAVSLVFLYPIGWLYDRFTPMHVVLGAIITLCLGSLLAFFSLMIRMVTWFTRWRFIANAGLVIRTTSCFDEAIPCQEIRPVFRGNQRFQLRGLDRRERPHRRSHGLGSQQLPDGLPLDDCYFCNCYSSNVASHSWLESAWRPGQIRGTSS